jgi:transposase
MEVELTVGAEACADCGGRLRRIGEDVTEELEYVPGPSPLSSDQWRTLARHRKPHRPSPADLRLAHKRFVQAPLPSRPIKRGRPGPGLLAHVLVSEYADHLPLYRQSQIFDREGLDLDRSTLADWVGNAKRHPEELIFGLLKTGFSTATLNGQSFFDTDHPVADAEGTVTSVANTDGGSGAPWFLLDTSRAIRPLIWQTRQPYEFVAMTQSNDEHVFNNDEYVFGMRARANAGFGLWQLAWGSQQTLNAANYAAARAAMMGFKADGGKVLGIKPTVLVVPPTLEEAARNIVNSATGASGATNPWANTAELIVSPYLA